MYKVICHHILQTLRLWSEFNDFRHLKMRKSVGKPKKVLPYISPYLNSITCGCVQNTATDAVRVYNAAFIIQHLLVLL